MGAVTGKQPAPIEGPPYDAPGVCFGRRRPFDGAQAWHIRTAFQHGRIRGGRFVRRRGMVEHVAPHRQPAGGGGLQREQRVVDRAQLRVDHDEQRQFEIARQVGHGIALHDWDEQAAGAFDEGQVVVRIDDAESGEDYLRIDSYVLQPRGHVGRKRGVEPVGTDVVEGDFAAGGRPQRQCVGGPPRHAAAAARLDRLHHADAPSPCT